MNYSTDEEILQDKNSETGKIYNWQGEKLNALLLSDSFQRLSFSKHSNYDSKALRVAECGTFLTFKRFEDGNLKLHTANFCKVRLCPMCQKRRSMKIFGQVSKVMDKLQENNKYKFIFLTLTIKNCVADELASVIDKLFYSFNKLTKKKEFKTAVKGYFRALEVTHNSDEDTFHPHFHCVLVVNNSYFTDTNYYISQSKWVDIWKQCLKVDYLPVVDVRTFKKSKKGIGKEVAEVAKYAVKPGEYLKKPPKVFENIPEVRKKFEEWTDYLVSVYDKCLANRRLVAFGGIMKKVHKELNLDDVNTSEDLVNTDLQDEVREDLNYILEAYQWRIGGQGLNYYKIKDFKPTDYN